MKTCPGVDARIPIGSARIFLARARLDRVSATRRLTCHVIATLSPPRDARHVNLLLKLFFKYHVQSLALIARSKVHLNG